MVPETLWINLRSVAGMAEKKTPELLTAGENGKNA
jgi:hypothetical protein